jgi:hypothetical protein
VVSKHSFAARTTIDGDDDTFENTRMMRKDASCGAAWSRPGLLTGDRTSYSSSKNGSINTTIWSHRRSGAPSATGTIAAHISRCVATSGNSDGTKIVQRESVLCFRPEVSEDQRDHPHSRISNMITIIVEFNGNWDDVLGGGDANLNLWHYHAAVFRIWCGVQIGLHLLAADIGDAPHRPNNNTSTIDDDVATNNAPWVVLPLPPPVFARLGRYDQNIMVASPARLLEHSLSSSSSSSKSTTPLEGLQGVADAFRGRLMVIRSGATTVTELRAALREVDANPNVEMWIQPPNDGLLWDLAWDRNLASPSNCRYSLLDQYRNDFLTVLGTEGRPRPPNRHVCYMSRQRRNKLGTPDRGNVRNLSPTFLLQLLGRLGSPILLTPSTALRRPPNSGGGKGAVTTTYASSMPYHSQLVQMEHISIAEQLQYVYDECAVLLGVHGAGLTNALGLRPGTAVIELQSKYKSDYQYFRNVAKLLNDVDYTVVTTLDGDGPDHEENLRATDATELDRLHALVEEKLQVSFHRQQLLQKRPQRD